MGDGQLPQGAKARECHRVNPTLNDATSQQTAIPLQRRSINCTKGKGDWALKVTISKILRVFT